MENRINTCATKEQIEGLCSPSNVGLMIQERMGSTPGPGDHGTDGQLLSGDGSRSMTPQEAMSRIMKFEKETEFLNEELKKLSSLLASKADRTDEEDFSRLKEEFARLSDELLKLKAAGEDVNNMRSKLEKMNQEMENLRYITDQAINDQTELSQNVNRVERALNNLTDVVYTKIGEWLKADNLNLLLILNHRKQFREN